MWTKICGIRDLATANAVARLQPDAVGLNFYEKTPRSVALDEAAKIVERLPDDIEPIGLFVNHPAAEIQDICRQCNLRTVQLHGDEPVELLAELATVDHRLKIIRAHRLGAEGLGPLADYLQQCRESRITVDACLIDARVDGLYGGSGKKVCWETLARDYRKDAWPPLILAGGLTPDNVAEAIETVQPWGVDVAGGVESKKGVKDLDRVARFIEAARAAATRMEDGG